MAAPLIRINNQLVFRDQVARFWLDGTTLKVELSNGTLLSKAFDTAALAASAHDVIKNLTEIDDIDGL